MKYATIKTYKKDIKAETSLYCWNYGLLHILHYILLLAVIWNNFNTVQCDMKSLYIFSMRKLNMSGYYSSNLLVFVFSLKKSKTILLMSAKLCEIALARHNEIPTLRYLTMTFKTNSIICMTRWTDLKNLAIVWNGKKREKRKKEKSSKSWGNGVYNVKNNVQKELPKCA